MRISSAATAACLLFQVIQGSGAAEAVRPEVDLAREVGEIRALHGVNGGPLLYGETVDLREGWRALAIPLARLHDCNWPAGDVVDVHSVFRDPRADPTRPESYDFARTDDFLRAIAETGAGIVFRLGESIEHSKRKYHVHPPADPGRWAAACIGIIRHVNEGWADGLRLGVRYWEIWNEPENRPQMWTGTDEDYFRLYAAAASAIKERWPDLRVGGPAVGDIGGVAGGEFRPSAFTTAFLEACRARSLPLDFFSWHTYTDDAWVLDAKARGVRALLDRHGFRAAESHLNEWNYLPGNDWSGMLAPGERRRRFYDAIGGAPGAAFAACALLALQDVPLDAACYYAGDNQGFGLWDWNGIPKKTFHAFRAFRMLRDTPVRAAAAGGEPGRLAIAAGRSAAGDAASILLARPAGPGDRFDVAVRSLPWRGAAAWRALVVDARRDLEMAAEGTVEPGGTIAIGEAPAPAACLIRLRPAAAR